MFAGLKYHPDPQLTPRLLPVPKIGIPVQKGPEKAALAHRLTPSIVDNCTITYGTTI